MTSTNRLRPQYCWRAPFPPEIQSALVTSEHPRGTLSLSDLELAGTIAHQDILTSSRHTAERTIWVGGDNTAALAWASKGSATSTAARAYLLRLNALHQRHYRYHPRYHHIPGAVNSMADAASRLWNLTDAALLTHFNLSYPQANSWVLRTLTPTMHSSLISALQRRPAVPMSLLAVPPPPIPHGASGRPSAPALASHPSWNPSPHRGASLFSSCLPSDIAAAPSPPAVDPSGLAQWRTPYALWRRRSPGWGPTTLD